MSKLYSIEALLGKGVGMSKALVCDRCGRVYSAKNVDWRTDKIPHKIKYGYDDGKDTHYVNSDLCQDCGKSFRDFMDMSPNPLSICTSENQ